jgi:glycerol-3-phosphate dehydrogenase
MTIARSQRGHEQPLATGYPDIVAQVVFAIRSEHCRCVADFLRRRTRLGASAVQGWNAAHRVAEVMEAELSWPPHRVAAEIEAYRRDIAVTRAFAVPS